MRRRSSKNSWRSKGEEEEKEQKEKDGLVKKLIRNA